MKLLITGAGGQLGMEWIDFCIFNEISFSAFNSAELDISNKDQLKEKLSEHNPDVIINCAAYTKVDEAEDFEQQSINVNATAVKYIAELCGELDIKLVHFSTDYVFSGKEEDKEQLPDGYPENHERNPVNKYGYSKFLGEKAIEESGCNYLLMRVSWLCGKYGNNFVKTMLRLGKEKDNLNLVDDQFGSPSFTENVVAHSYQLLKSKETGIFHTTSNGLITWYEFAKEIFDQKGITVNVKPVSSEEFPTKAKRPAFSKLSTKKISKIEEVNITHWKVGLKNLLEHLE
tara:strand:+ start:12869 stop:13729 length:861 start_codon:yes stop_codon:yes gene_type:complete